MDTSFPSAPNRCYQQAARLMARGASLSVALRDCASARGERPRPRIVQSPVAARELTT